MGAADIAVGGVPFPHGIVRLGGENRKVYVLSAVCLYGYPLPGVRRHTGNAGTAAGGSSALAALQSVSGVHRDWFAAVLCRGTLQSIGQAQKAGSQKSWLLAVYDRSAADLVGGKEFLFRAATACYGEFMLKVLQT